MHTNPEVLALVALGEQIGDQSDHEHLRTCAECSTELADLRRITALAEDVEPGLWIQAPPERVWQRIRSEIQLLRAETAPARVSSGFAAPPAPGPRVGSPLSPITPRTPVAARSDAQPTATSGATGERRETAGERTGRRLLSLVLAAAVALVAGIGIGIGVDRLGQPQERIIGRATLSARPGWTGATGTAVVREDRNGNRTLVVTLDTPRPVDGAVQVWLADPTVGGMRAMGWIDDGSGFWSVPPDLDLAKYPVVDVSDEPLGDTNATHSGQSIVRGQLAP